MELNQDTIRKIRSLIIFTVITVLLGVNWRHLITAFRYVLELVRPFLLGAGIAFVLNILMRGIEARIRIGKPSVRRALSIGLSFLTVLILLLLGSLVIVPQIADSVLTLKQRIPAFWDSALLTLNTYFADRPELLALFEEWIADWDTLYRELQGILSQSVGNLLSGSFLAVKGIAGAVANLFIGLFFAIYLLAGKETLSRQAGRLLQAFLPERVFLRTKEVLLLCERKFSGFITGQCLEACILGLMFVLALTLFRLPYALLCGVLIAFTALIPVFGAFIGFVIGCFLMLIQSPADALLFAAIFLVLQQLEGNLIYPHVVGGSVELPAIWVLVAVTLGGSMFGVLGMLLFIPLFSVLYTLLREKVHKNLCVKGSLEKPEVQGPSGTESGACAGTCPERDRGTNTCVKADVWPETKTPAETNPDAE